MSGLKDVQSKRRQSKRCRSKRCQSKRCCGTFLFTFVLFKHNITEKTVDFSGIRTQIIGLEGKHADHLTTTTALPNITCFKAVGNMMY